MIKHEPEHGKNGCLVLASEILASAGICWIANLAVKKFRSFSRA